MTVTALRTLTGQPVLHQQALHGLAGDIVRSLAPYTEASDAGVLFSLLAGFGAMVGHEPYIQAGSRQAARLWPMLIGPTSTGRKGTSWTVASMPLWFADRGTFLGYNVASGLSTGEGLVHMVRDPEEPDPTRRNSKADEGVADKRRLILEPEFARTLAASRRDNNTLSSVLREAWEGSDLHVATRTRPLRATRPHIAVIAHCTATELRAKLADTDLGGGLVNRFLLVSVKRSKLLPAGDKPPDELLRAFGAQLRERLTAAREGPSRLRRTTGAEKLWKELYLQHLNPDLDEDSHFAQSVTRGPAYVARLSLAYALLDGSHEIDEIHVVAAAAAWNYCFSSAQTIFESGAPLGETDDVTRAEAYIRACGDKGVTRSKLSTLFRRSKGAAELDGLTQQLIEGGNVAFGPIPDRSKHPVLVWVGGEQQISQISRSFRGPSAV